MITELNTTDVYRLKDKEGWLDNSTTNKYFLMDRPEILTGFVLNDLGAVVTTSDIITGFVLNDLGTTSDIIAKDEYKFFEVVTESVTEKPHLALVKNPLWDGKSPIEVRMVVIYEDKEHTVLMNNVTSGQVLVQDNHNNDWSIIHNCHLKAATKPEKEHTFEEVLESWKRKGLDYGFDTVSSSVPFGEVFDVVYDVMKGEKE